MLTVTISKISSSLHHSYTMASAAATTSSSNRLDFKTLLESHAYVSYLKSTRKTRKIQNFLVKGTSSEFENLRFEVNWDNARLELQAQEWTFPESKIEDSARPIHETWQYEDSMSDFEVTNEHKDKTKAVFSLMWNEGNTAGLGLNSPIELPSEAKAVFSDTACLDINGPSFETQHEQEWALSVKVPVPKGLKAKVTTTLHEQTFNGTFKCQAYLRGQVTVQIFKKKKNQLITTVSDPIAEFWKKLRRDFSNVKYDLRRANRTNPIENRLDSFNTISVNTDDMKWNISGECRFTIGTHGSVKVEKVT